MPINNKTHRQSRAMQTPLRLRRQIGNVGLGPLTMLYLALPMPFFLFGWLKAVYALPLTVLLVFLPARFCHDLEAIG